MKTSKRRRYKPKLSVSIVALGALAGGALIAAPAAAVPQTCTVAALTALGVPNVTIADAVDVPANGSTPEFCDVSGTVITTGEGAPDGLAHFEVQLPANWNHKLYVKGMGGFAGFSGFSGVPIGAFASDNAVDDAQVLAKGYATAISDTGHTGQGFNAADSTGIVTDARWALNGSTTDEAELTDYFFRATHDLTVAAKQLAEGFFAQGTVRRAYFDGCSNGGRMALQEASRFPDDFDGIIAGDPFMSARSIAAGPNFDKQQLTPKTFIPFTLLPLIDQAVLASCEAADDVKDGLIQNPAACSFKAQTLPCPKGQTTNCLSQGQVDTLNAYFSGARDDDGHVVYPGFTVSELSGLDGEAAWTNGIFLPGQALPPGDTRASFELTAPEPWGDNGFTPAPLGWQFVDHAIKYIVERDPKFRPAQVRRSRHRSAERCDAGAVRSTHRSGRRRRSRCSTGSSARTGSC
jgi:feruloyl esterase